MNDDLLASLDAEEARLLDELAEVRRLRSDVTAFLSRRTPTPSVTPGPNPGPINVGPAMTVKDWIRVVLTERGGLGAAAIARRATELGWVTTSSHQGTVIRNNLRSMEDAHEVRRDGSGYFLGGWPEGQEPKTSSGPGIFEEVGTASSVG